MEAHRHSLTRWTNRAFLQKCRALSCSKQGSSDMPAILLLKEEAVRTDLPIKRSHMHLKGCKRKQLQNKVRPSSLTKKERYRFPSQHLQSKLAQSKGCCATLQSCKEVLKIQEGLRCLRVDSDSMQASSFKIKAAFKLWVCRKPIKSHFRSYNWIGP